MFAQPAKGLLLPPMRRGGQGMGNKQSAPLGLELLAMMDQLLALTRNMPSLFFFLARDADHSQLAGVAFQVTGEPLAKGGRIARIGLHPRAGFVQFARGDDIGVRSEREQLPVEAKAKPAGFVDEVHAVPGAEELRHPGKQLGGSETPGRLRQKLIELGHGDVEPGMDVESDLDTAGGSFTFVLVASGEATLSL